MGPKLRGKGIEEVFSFWIPEALTLISEILKGEGALCNDSLHQDKKIEKGYAGAYLLPCYLNGWLGEGLMFHPFILLTYLPSLIKIVLRT